MKMQSELNNFKTPVFERAQRRQAAAAPQKRKFNLVLGLKRCFNDFNEYMGIETKGDKIFYHTYFWGTVIIGIGVLKMGLAILNSL